MKRRTAIWIGIVAALVLLGAVVQIFRICRAEDDARFDALQAEEVYQ